MITRTLNGRTSDRKRRGLTVLETTIAFALAALLMTPVVGLLHTSRQIWEMSDTDNSRLTSLHGTLNHIRDRVKYARSVVTAKSDGRKPAILEISGRNGQVERWQHDARNRTVMFTTAGTGGLLANNIDAISFEGFDSNGRPTTAPASITQLRCTATITLKRKNNETRTSECWIWLRP